MAAVLHLSSPGWPSWSELSLFEVGPPLYLTAALVISLRSSSSTHSSSTCSLRDAASAPRQARVALSRTLTPRPLATQQAKKVSFWLLGRTPSHICRAKTICFMLVQPSSGWSNLAPHSRASDAQCLAYLVANRRRRRPTSSPQKIYARFRPQATVLCQTSMLVTLGG